MGYKRYGWTLDDQLERSLLAAGVTVEDSFGARPTRQGIQYLRGLNDVEWTRLLGIAVERGVAAPHSPIALDRNHPKWEKHRSYFQSEQYRRYLLVRGEFGVETPRPWTRAQGYGSDEHWTKVAEEYRDARDCTLVEMTEAA